MVLVVDRLVVDGVGLRVVGSTGFLDVGLSIGFIVVDPVVGRIFFLLSRIQSL